MYGNDFGSGAAGLGSLMLISGNHTLTVVSFAAFAAAATAFVLSAARRTLSRAGA